jgi:hypothetical protein
LTIIKLEIQLINSIGGKNLPRIISKVEQKKVENFLRKTLEPLQIKNLVYKILIVPIQEIKLHRLKKIVNNYVPPEKYDGKKILFNSLDARHMTHTYLESSIAKSLQLRGNNVKMLICGKTLSMCTTFHRLDHPPNEWSCNNCLKFSRQVYEIIGLNYSTYNEYIKNDEIEEIKKRVNNISFDECKKLIYKDVKVGFHALTSAERYYKGGIPRKEDLERIVRLELINAIISTDVAEKVLEIEKPDILVTSHGIYSSWGSFSEYLMKKGIRTCIWSMGEGATVTFDRHKSEDYFKSYVNKIRNNKPLNEEEEKELDNFFDKRISGKEGQVAFYEFSDTTKETLEKEFRFSKYDNTYVIFPNVPWDADLSTANTVFEGVHDWIISTIDFFKKKPNLQLIVKIHPSELKVMESESTVLDYINSKYSSIPENIKIIPPNTTISPYSLFPFIDVGIVYIGTIGLEMAANNIPVIVAGDAHYSNKGFTYDISTKEDYFKALLNEVKPLTDQEQLAKIYSYFHFIKKFIPRSFIYTNNFLDIGWNVNSVKDFEPGKNRYLDHICNYIVNNGIFQNW